MQKGKHKNGFTLVELLLALMITALVVTAVATLGSAMSSANNSTGNTAVKQAQLRYATIKIGEIIRNCRMICHLEENNFAIWRADDNSDGKLNLNELVYIGSDFEKDYLRIFEFYDDTRVLQISDIRPVVTGWDEYGCSTYRDTRLILQCENVQLAVDATPPWSKFASISFDIEESGVMRHYQITAALRCRAGHLLDEYGQFVFADDDE